MNLGFAFRIQLEIKDDWRAMTTALQRLYGAVQMSFVAQADGSPLSMDTPDAQRQAKLAGLSLQDNPEWVLSKGFSTYDLSPVELGPKDDWEAFLRTWLTVRHNANELPKMQHSITYRVMHKRGDCKIFIMAYLFATPVIIYLGQLLARIIRDYPEAGATLGWTPYFNESDIPPWMQSSYRQLLDWLSAEGGHAIDVLELHSPYEMQIAAMSKSVPDLETAPASEAGIDAARGDGPAASEAGIDAARADRPAALSETDPDSIPRWGRRRDLSTHEVREIVRRCKAYQAAGGSIAKFHERESLRWPDPEDSPGAYSQATLESWARNQRFQ